jgi:hypothetical protein
MGRLSPSGTQPISKGFAVTASLLLCVSCTSHAKHGAANSSGGGAAKSSGAASPPSSAKSPPLAGRPLVTDVGGNGDGDLVVIPSPGSINVGVICTGGKVRIVRQPDIDSTITCNGEPAMVGFPNVKITSKSPMRLEADPKTRWIITVGLEDRS